MSNKQKLYLFLIAGISLIFLSLIYQFNNHSQDNSKDSISKIIYKCSSRDTSSYYFCFKEKIKPYVKKLGVNEVVDSLNLIFKNNPSVKNNVSCHDLSHIVGEVSIETGKNLGDTLINCTKSCEYGCAHGALIGGMKNDSDTLKEISNICKPFYSSEYHLQDRDACEHGLGHAVTELTAMDLFKSLDLCALLETESAANKCAEGVFMQTIDYPEVPYFKIEGTIVSFCSTLPIQFENVCLDTASIHEHGRSKDIEKSKIVCDQVPSKNKSKCVINLVNLLYSNYDASPEKLLEFCKKYKAQDYNSCIKGVIEPDIISDSSARVSIFLCNSSSTQDKISCYKTLGERYEYVYGKQKRIDFCTTLEKEIKNYCLPN